MAIDIGIAATLAAAAIDGGSRGTAFWLAMATFAVVGSAGGLRRPGDPACAGRPARNSSMSAGARHGETARERLVAAMSEQSFYPHRVRDVELRETGISWVFLAGERVYKVKKPVVLPFLDYGTLERRRLMCEEEIRLNRRLAPETYLGVWAIRASDGRFSLDGNGGQVVEWAVEMRRLPEERTFERLVRAGRVEPGQLRSLGERLAVFHRRVEQVPDTEGGPGAVKRTVEENLQELVPLAGAVVDPVRLRAAERFASAWLDVACACLRQRDDADRRPCAIDPGQHRTVPVRNALRAGSALGDGADE